MVDNAFHRLFDRHRDFDGDEVGRHSRTDLVVVVFFDEFDIFCRVFVEKVENFRTFVLFEFVKDFDSVVRVHFFDYVRGFFAVEFGDEVFNVVEVSEYFGNGFVA